jgi:hypothetical protein
VQGTRRDERYLKGSVQEVLSQPLLLFNHAKRAVADCRWMQAEHDEGHSLHSDINAGSLEMILAEPFCSSLTVGWMPEGRLEREESRVAESLPRIQTPVSLGGQGQRAEAVFHGVPGQVDGAREIAEHVRRPLEGESHGEVRD